MKRLLSLALVLTLVSGLTGCCMKHQWIEADCVTPRTCANCGETEGEPLGHTWMEPDCVTPRTCSVCGETEGQPLGHEPGSWRIAQLDPLALTETEEQICSRCGEVIDTRETELTALYQDDLFLIHAQDFADRLDSILKTNVDDSVSASIAQDGGIFHCAAMLGDHMLGDYLFMARGTLKETNRNLAVITADLYGSSTDTLIMVLFSMMAVDPTLDIESDVLTDFLGSALLEAEDGFDRELNGLLYCLSTTEDGLHLEILPAP